MRWLSRYCVLEMRIPLIVEICMVMCQVLDEVVAQVLCARDEDTFNS